MGENQGAGPLEADEFRETRTWMDSQYNKYMHARRILSTLSESTLRRYSPRSPKQPRKNREEEMVLHRMIAALHVYESDAVACAQSGADFASGLMASAACEGLAIVGLIRKKRELRQSTQFTKHWKAAKEIAKRRNITLTLSKFLLNLRFQELFSLARAVGLYNEQNLPEQVAEALEERGWRGRLTDFVRRARNCIHPRWNIDANEEYAKALDVMYPIERMKSFHVDFALCAWELHGRLAEGLKSKDSSI